LTALASYECGRALAFLTTYLYAQAGFFYSFSIACSYFHVVSSLFTHADVLTHISVEMDNSFTKTRLSLKMLIKWRNETSPSLMRNRENIYRSNKMVIQFFLSVIQYEVGVMFDVST